MLLAVPFCNALRVLSWMLGAVCVCVCAAVVTTAGVALQVPFDVLKVLWCGDCSWYLYGDGQGAASRTQGLVMQASVPVWRCCCSLQCEVLRVSWDWG